MHASYRAVNAENRYDPSLGQLTGLTPLSYTAGALPAIYDQQVSVNMLLGSFGSEVGLLADAAERTGSLTIGGSDNLPAQAVLFASTKEPLVGEELFAGGAYLQVNPMHTSSLIAQDVLRWVVDRLHIIRRGDEAGRCAVKVTPENPGFCNYCDRCRGNGVVGIFHPFLSCRNYVPSSSIGR